MTLPLFDYAASIKARDTGMAIAASAETDWVARARSVAEMLAAKTGECTINDVYAIVGMPDHYNAAGSVFLPRKKWCCVGYAQSGRVKRKAGLIRRWCLV